MDLKEFFFKKLEEKCKRDFESYVYDFENNYGKGKYYNEWYYVDDMDNKLKTYDYETFVDKFLDEILHCHGEILFSVHSKYGH